MPTRTPETHVANKKKIATPRLSQTERVALSDSRMFEAAMRLIGERGTHNTTLKEVGEEAGYSRGLASNRFGSKEALFSNLVTYFNSKWKQELEKFVAGRTGLDAFLASLDAVEDFLLNQPTYMKAMYILWYESISSHSEVRERLAKQHDVYRDDAARWLEEAKREGQIRRSIETKSFAVLYWSFLSGTIYQWLVRPEAIDLKVIFRQYKSSALQALVEPGGAKRTSGNLRSIR
jgi:AcrR family transcriptional regulator